MLKKIKMPPVKKNGWFLLSLAYFSARNYGCMCSMFFEVCRGVKRFSFAAGISVKRVTGIAFKNSIRILASNIKNKEGRYF
jgi:hypothetical protein